MGYSTPKKPLDLKEFLSQPAKKRAGRGFATRRAPTFPAPRTPSAPHSEDESKD